MVAMLRVRNEHLRLEHYARQIMYLLLEGMV
jgi:hypothetical protein